MKPSICCLTFSDNHGNRINLIHKADNVTFLSPNLSIDPLPISDIEEREAHKRRFRFKCLKEVEEKYAADEASFLIVFVGLVDMGLLMIYAGACPDSTLSFASSMLDSRI